MNKIFIEAESKKTSEYYFLEAIIRKFFPAIEVQFIFMKGVDNLFNQPILNEIKKANIEGSQILVLVDADSEENKWGYKRRKDWIEGGMKEHDVSFPYFIYPNNQNDGLVETLMEAAALYAPNKVFFDCYTDYETCLKNSKYNIPSLKGKVYAYAEAQTIYDIQKGERIPLINKINSGDWLFDNPDYWNLDVENLQPLKDFFKQYLK
ncbi:MAG: DUF3226 domain-containing protein [Bacteroidales bacterium]|nr:DUF3226 domain-containing protein [Bacteroidales bacterium]MEE1119957.1 DUF3226 domain-containing protein [Bacteroidales bacterium]